MGGPLSKYSASSKFILGFGTGFIFIWYTPHSYYGRLRILFPQVEGVNVTIEPEKPQTIYIVQDEPEGEKEEDEEYQQFKQSYINKMLEYADKEEALTIKRSPNSNTTEKLKDVIVEYEAVKRLEKKRDLRKTE
jgi:hypothetical protein